MKYDSNREWRERSFQFACKLFDFCDDLGQRPGPSRRLSYQLFDAGSSIGANLAESQASRLAEAKSLGRPELRQWLLQEADEFVAMLTIGVKNLQR